jgi:hypothetical protein
VELSEPRPNRALISAFSTIAPAYLCLALKLRSVKLIGETNAVEAVRDFQEGRSRLIIAFRHPYGDEPELIASVIARSIPGAARALGRPLPKPSHAHFIHGYEVALWRGAVTRWILPRTGAVPIHHVKMDSVGLERIRRLMLDGPYPLALAPEGQVSYTSEAVPRLERGFAAIAYRCAEDLEAAHRPERVVVLPLSVHYRHGRSAPAVLRRLLRIIERECGLVPRVGAAPLERLKTAAESLVAEAESFYAELEGTGKGKGGASTLNERWAAVIEAALRAGERALRLKPEADTMRRIYRIRQAGWDRIYRDELKPHSQGRAGRRRLSPLARSLLDRGAGEAWYAMRHMELADIGFYMDFDSLREDSPIDLYVETAYNYVDLISRLRGGNISDRLNIATKNAVIVFGAPLEFRGKLQAYSGGRKAALEAAERDLEKSYLDCIESYRKEYDHGER